jgi:hypothetical protein
MTDNGAAHIDQHADGYMDIPISDVLGALYPDPNELICLRGFKPKGAPDDPQFFPIKKAVTRVQLSSNYALQRELKAINKTRGLYFVVNGVEDRKRKYAERAIEIACNIISEAPDGSRHHARLRGSRLLGGYIAGGMLTEFEARNALESAVRGNTDNFRDAMKTIDSGLKYGLSSPITFEQLERAREAYFQRHQRQARPIVKPTSPEERRARREALRQMTAAAISHGINSISREISQCTDILNFIFSRSRCPVEVKEFILAVIGAVQEKTQSGSEDDWFEANDFEIGKRMRGDNDDKPDRVMSRKEIEAAARREGVSIGEFRAKYERRRSERIKKAAQRKRAKTDEWQKRTGYIFVESQNGSKKEGQDFDTRYRVPMLIEAAEALLIAREKLTGPGNPKKIVQGEAKAALARLEGTLVKRDRFKRPGRDAKSVFESNHKLIFTKFRKNLHLAPHIGIDPIEYYGEFSAETKANVSALGFNVDSDEQSSVHREQKNNMDKTPTGCVRQGERLTMPVFKRKSCNCKNKQKCGHKEIWY